MLRRRLAIFLLVCAIGVGCWFGSAYYTAYRLEPEVSQRKHEYINQASASEPSFAERRAAIIDHSLRLAPVYVAACNSYEESQCSELFGSTYASSVSQDDIRTGQIRAIAICLSLMSLRDQIPISYDMLNLEMGAVDSALIQAIHQHKQMLITLLMSCSPSNISECLSLWESIDEVGLLYDKVATTWQPILDEYDISYTEIGLSEPLVGSA